MTTAMEIRERAFGEINRSPENHDMIAANMGKAMLHSECEWPKGITPESQGRFIDTCLLELARRAEWALRRTQVSGPTNGQA